MKKILVFLALMIFCTSANAVIFPRDENGVPYNIPVVATISFPATAEVGLSSTAEVKIKPPKDIVFITDTAPNGTHNHSSFSAGVDRVTVVNHGTSEVWITANAVPVPPAAFRLAVDAAVTLELDEITDVYYWGITDSAEVNLVVEQW
jgi:hypothetical protein